MSRNQYILLAALLSVAVLAVALASQLSALKQHWHSTVRIVPGESKTRAGEDGFNPDVAPALARPAVLVKFRAGIPATTITEITARFNDHVLDEIEAVPGLTAISNADDADPTSVAARYARLPEVEFAEPNYEISLEPNNVSDSRVPISQPRFEDQWALANDGRNGGLKGADISVMQAWTTSNGSDQLVVGVLDTGVDYNHIDLVNNMWMRPANLQPYQDRDRGTVDDLHGFDVTENSGEPDDENGQGTNIAGIIGAECGNQLGICGVNWRVRILPLKFLNAGGFGTLAGASAAINYAIERRRAGVNLRIINTSWILPQRSRALEEVIRKAGEAGILFVAAAGSSGSDNDARPSFPANYDTGNIVAVAATDRNDALAQFSNYGAQRVHLGAPGKDILTTALGNEYELRNGTAMAAAVVTGVAALGLAAHPQFSVSELRSWLLAAVDKVPGLRGKVSTSGRINAARAVAGRHEERQTRPD
jgi:subtilisin family serine protease